jgi:hypothetical protein
MTIENLTLLIYVLVQTWNLLVVDVKKKIIRIKKWQQKMATVNVYIDGTTLSNSTAVYADAGLTSCAAPGFYSDGSISREQVIDAAGKCSLLPNQTCPSCVTECGGPTVSVSSGVTGYYILDIDTGGTSTDTYQYHQV